MQAKPARQCHTQPPSDTLREVRNLSESTSCPTLCPIDYQQVSRRCSGFSLANCRPLSRDGALVPFADPLGSSDLNTVPRNLSAPPASIRKRHSRGSNPGPCECKTTTLLTELRALDDDDRINSLLAGKGESKFQQTKGLRGSDQEMYM